MLWRHLWLVRAWSAAGLLTCTTFGTPALAEPEEPAPAAGDVTKTVRILEARKAGDLAFDVRGHGQETVRVAIQNTSDKRLNVVLPPGLVATSALGQGGRGGGGGGFQSMGLGAVGNRAGGFGQFQNGAGESGFQSIPVTVTDEKPARAVTVPVGKTVEVNLPSVCLNYGLPTPTPRDRFELVDVDQYSQNPRVRKALRSLATYGTSHGTAQAVMWNVCNNLPFEFMGEQTTKVMNVHEIALAARFVEGLDASGSNATELVDPAYLTEARIFVQIQGEGALAKDAERLNPELDGARMLGLPVRVVSGSEAPAAVAPALLVKAVLANSQTGETRGRLFVSHADGSGTWVPLGKTAFTEGSSVSVLDGATLARTLDHALASAFVTVKVAKRSTESTTLKVDNHLPFTLSGLTVKATGSSGAPPVSFEALGIGPARSANVAIQAAGASVDHIELNGL
jgi:hypothetical protein